MTAVGCKNMKSLKQLLNKKNPAGKIKKAPLDNETIFFIFKKIIKEDFGQIGAAKFMPDYFTSKTLFIKSTSSTWSSELWLNRQRIIRKINVELGEEFIKEIKIK